MEKKIKRIYIDSSVVYGAPAKEFSEDSRRFWEAYRNGEFTLIVSDVLEKELKRSPAYVRMLFAKLPEPQIEQIVSTSESNDLAERYIAEGVVDVTNIDDCRHIALATIHCADAIVSWNFQDMIYRRAGYNDINEKMGYPGIEILTPKQLMEVSHDET